MKKILLLIVKINISLVLSSSIVACSSTSNKDDGMSNIWKLSYKGYDYGYNLPKAKSGSTADMSSNVIQCTSLETVSEQYFCILDVAYKALNKSKETSESIKNASIAKVAEFANDQLHYIGHPGYGIYKK